MGEQVGIDYDGQTTVTRIHVGRQGMLDKLAADLALPGASATWSMRFQAGGGHALAGTNGLVSITPTMHRMSLHVFDPNVGEYAGTIQDLPSILGDLFQRFPLYLTVTEVHRTRAGARGNP